MSAPQFLTILIALRVLWLGQNALRAAKRDDRIHRRGPLSVLLGLVCLITAVPLMTEATVSTHPLTPRREFLTIVGLLAVLAVTLACPSYGKPTRLREFSSTLSHVFTLGYGIVFLALAALFVLEFVN